MYNTATIIQKDNQQPGDYRTRIVVRFTCNAGEPDVERERWVDGDTTAASLRQWAREEAVRLTGRKTIADNLTVGQSIVLTAPAGPTLAEQTKAAWFASYQRLLRVEEAVAKGILSTNAAEVVALRDAVRTGYLAAYLGDF